MKLGGSMRRRRPKGQSGGKKSRAKGSSSGPGVRAWFSGVGLRGLGLAVLAVVVGGGIGFLAATRVAFPAPEETVVDLLEVPDLRGTSADEASRLLEERELVVGRVDSILHPDVPSGQVVGQAPFPGQFAIRGGEVELAISLGPERRPVPDVTRLRADRALTVLRTTGFEVMIDSIDHDDPAGRVVATEPEVGTEAALPSRVTMFVSLGPPMVALPDLIGRQEDEARRAIQELGLAVGEVETRFQFGFRQGEVLRTRPEAGDSIPRGGEVHLEVGRRGFLRDDGGGGR